MPNDTNRPFIVDEGDRCLYPNGTRRSGGEIPGTFCGVVQQIIVLCKDVEECNVWGQMVRSGQREMLDNVLLDGSDFVK